MFAYTNLNKFLPVEQKPQVFFETLPSFFLVFISVVYSLT